MSTQTINISSTIRQALAALNRLSGGVMTLLVTDNNNRLEGTLTDGDIRRAILAGASIDGPLAPALHRSFRFIRKGSYDVELLQRCRADGIRLLPVVDEHNSLIDTIDLHTTPTLLPLTATLMAGGKGERLRPLTLNTPKPLLKVGHKAIIDYNIDAVRRCGITDITVSVNYLADQFYHHFNGTEVKIFREPEFLGTIGSAREPALRTRCDHTLVMNSDLLSDIDLEKMWMLHSSEQADITVAAVPYTLSVPYAVLETDGNRVSSLSEKPTYSYMTNAGVYMVRTQLLRNLPQAITTHATHLIERTIADGGKVIHYPHKGTWIDIGSPSDYHQACELMKHNLAFKH